jgi:hypothetical protein
VILLAVHIRYSLRVVCKSSRLDRSLSASDCALERAFNRKAWQNLSEPTGAPSTCKLTLVIEKTLIVDSNCCPNKLVLCCGDA